MKNTIKWKTYTKFKLRCIGIGTKQWWSLVKDKQGLLTRERIPSFKKEDGSYLRTSEDKSELLAAMSSNSMTTQDHVQCSLFLTHLYTHWLEDIIITEASIQRLLKASNTRKAVGPDNISLHLLKKVVLKS